jgi:hypothetical protein
MNARRGTPAAPGKRPQRWLVVAMLALSLAGIAGVALYAHDPQGVALGLVPLALLLATLP